MIVQGAYGRTYSKQADIKRDWESGEDFQIIDIFAGYGRYVNKQDVQPGQFIEFRYGRQNEKVFGMKA